MSNIDKILFASVLLAHIDDKNLRSSLQEIAIEQNLVETAEEFDKSLVETIKFLEKQIVGYIQSDVLKGVFG